MKLNDMDTPEFIEKLNKVNSEQQRGKKDDQSGQRSYTGFTIDVLTDIENLIVQCRKIQAITGEGMKHLSKGQWAKVILVPKLEKSQMFQDLLFGSFDYMRAELEVMHSGE